MKPQTTHEVAFLAVAMAMVLALSLTVAALPAAGQAPAGEEEAVVRGAFDDYDGDAESAVSKPPTPADDATGRYSPFAGRKHPTHVYFGDTHHHTANSGDGFMAGDRLTPEQAYRFARGEEVVSSTGVPAKLSRPLDFLVVSDHAEGLGIMYQVYDANPALMADPTLPAGARR